MSGSEIVEFKLRDWAVSDLENLILQANNPRIAANLTDQFPYPYTRESGEWFIGFANSHLPRRIFAIEINGKASGSIGVFPQDDIHRLNAEMGYWLAETWWGKGIMTKAIRQMVEYGFNTFAIDRIFARPFGSNKASQRVLEKAGFKLEAVFKQNLIKNGIVTDELYYSIRRADTGIPWPKPHD